MIEKDYYYIDKTLLIKDILEKGGQVNLFTRPRRFGKTLALTMLRTFFEAEIDRNGALKDNRHYFDGMKIMEAGEEYTRHLGQYPVIFLSLKSAKQPNFGMAYEMLKRQIKDEFDRHAYVLKTDALDEVAKERYRKICDLSAGPEEYAAALAFLSKCLEQYHDKKTIILLDEYDVPLENSYFQGFYDEMIQFIRSLFESALKTNESLEFAIITGCLRISKESIFTGLNNLEIISILNRQFAESFGFTQTEAEQILMDYGLEQRKQEMKEWYDGYLFGEVEVYNPWSVINYVKTAVFDEHAFPKPYWSNTSSNSIVKELVQHADSKVKKEIEHLIADGTIEKQVHDAESNLVNSSGAQNELSARRFFEINETKPQAQVEFSEKNILDYAGMDIWNFLFFTGYLKAVSQRFEGDTTYLTMKIPNAEIRYIYRNTIQEWFEQKIKVWDFAPMYKAIFQGDAEGFERMVKQQLSGSISYFDSEEQFYHGFLLGLLRPLQDYEVVSNRESGDGRPDIELKPYDELKPAVILEIKHVKQFPQMENGCREALKQIEEKRYAEGLLEEGYHTVMKYGICFCRKSCRIVVDV